MTVEITCAYCGPVDLGISVGPSAREIGESVPWREHLHSESHLGMLRIASALDAAIRVIPHEPEDGSGHD